MGLSRRGFLTVSTAIGLSLLYGIYAHFVTPLVTPPLLTMPGLDFQQRPLQSPTDSRKSAERWLSSQPWAARAAYQLRTEDAFVYFDEWTQTDGDEAVRLRPFALIWMTEGDDGTEEPIRISCDSAYLKFESEFQMPNSNPGRVIGGALEGNVRIQGKDGLDVVGKNFVFSESAMRIWSDNHVRFNHGAHKGHALGLQMELIPDTTADPNDTVAVSGIKIVRLRRNVVMDLQLGDNLPTKRKSAVTSNNSQPDTPVRIRCDGSFSFETESNLARYEDNVRILRPVALNQFDTLECDALTLKFEPDEEAPPQPKPESEESSRFEGISGKLTFRRLIATGQQVLLVSQTNDMRASMAQLEYDAKSRVATMTDNKDVRVWQGESELRAPEISLTQDETGEATSAFCRGAGQLTFHDKQTGQVELHAKWVKQLRKYPDANSQLDIIELHEQAVVRQPQQQSGLAAEFIKLWIEPEPKENEPAASQRTAINGKPPQQMRINRMLAMKNVAMLSPEMHADTERLEVWFEEAVLPPPAQKSNGQRNTLAYGARGLSTQQQPESQPRMATAPRLPDHLLPAGSVNATPYAARKESGDSLGSSPLPRAPAEKEKQPAVVVSDLIRARILHDGQQQRSEVAEIWTFGNVEVTQQNGADKQPLKISGDRMHMENKSETDQVVHVFGKPAHIRDEQMHIQGNNVHLDRIHNHAWVDGEGLLQIPVNNDLDGKPLDVPEILDVWWQDKMTFDGETAKFFGQVTTQIQQSRMLCREMEVLLTERISFVDAEKPEAAENEKPDIDIKHIVCKGGVNVESREYVERQLAQIRRAKFQELTLNQQTGKQLAAGPGWIKFWKKADGNQSGLSTLATVRANKPLETANSAWEYSRIDFAGKSDGNMKQRFTTFSEQVEIVHGPVEEPLDTIDPDDIPANGGWMRCDKMQLTQFEKTATQPAFLKMLGSGNAEMEGRMPGRNRSESSSENFRARADTISFDQSKGLYILRSNGSRTATIWRWKERGGDPSQHDAKRMEFIPALNQLKSDRAIGTIGIE